MSKSLLRGRPKASALVLPRVLNSPATLGNLGGWFVSRHMNTNNEPEDEASAVHTMTDEEIWRMIEEDFGLPKVIPLTHKKTPWGQLTHEQIVEKIECILIEDFDVPKEVPLTFIREIQWKTFTPEQIETEILRILRENCVTQDDQVVSTIIDEIFKPQGNLTGSPLFEGQRVEVHSEYGSYRGIISYLLSDDSSFMLDVEEGDLNLGDFFFVNKVTVTNFAGVPGSLPLRGYEDESQIIDDPLPCPNSGEALDSLEDVKFFPKGNLTGSELFVGQRIIVECASGRFVGKVGDLKSRAESVPVAIRNGAFRLWPDETPGISKSFVVALATISSE